MLNTTALVIIDGGTIDAVLGVLLCVFLVVAIIYLLMRTRR